MRNLTFYRNVLFLGLMSILATGCATVAPPILPPAPVPNIFRSDDYIIYRLQDRETPEMLAEQFLGDSRKSWMIEEANEKIPFRTDQLVVIPLKQRNKGGVTDDGYQTVPILCYHRFGSDGDSPLCVPTDVFERQLNYLKTNGYRVISPEEILEYLSYRRQLPKKSVMITIDDGYRSVYNVAFPLLKKYGFQATLFVYTNYVGVSGKAITWDQLRELKANGWTIGSHTVAHSDLTKIADDETDKAYLARLKHEIFDSKKIIDKMLKQDTYFFAYPFGRANETAAILAYEAGYRMAVTVDRGGNPFFANPYFLQRDQVLKRDMATFAKRLKTFYSLPLR
jgi:peptidoglycan/xylan/chitin deacetylase (PgdA/CDA1 family)